MSKKDIYSSTEVSNPVPKIKKQKSTDLFEDVDKTFLIKSLVENDFRETLTNVFNNSEIIIRILLDSCDVALVENFEYWEYDKLNNFKIYIPTNEDEFEQFVETIDNLV